MKRLLLTILALAVLGAGICLSVSWYAHRPWQQWQDFVAGFVQPDGRVVDQTFGAKSTSEGQSYGLFFALVANDRAAFQRILDWTENNLANGDLKRELPAWLWGQSEDGVWGVRDTNPASDSNLWIAYSLFEAARLWAKPEYEALARQVLWNVRQQEVVTLGELGPMLIPARKGFTLNEQGLRFNPSYLPEFQLRYFAAVDSSGPWAQMLRTADDLFGKAHSNGVMPDWFEYYMASGVRPDAKTGGVSSYDAIRVYLWAGMTPNSRWLAQLAPYVKIIEKRGFPPERVEPRSQAITEGQPLGFSAAVLPFLSALNEDTLLKKQLERLSRSRVNGGLGDPAHYYDQVLALFGEGWVSDRYQFDEDGKLMPRWRRTCCSALQR